MKLGNILFRIMFTGGVSFFACSLAYQQALLGKYWRGICCLLLAALFLLGCYLQSKIKEGIDCASAEMNEKPEETTPGE